VTTGGLRRASAIAMLLLAGAACKRPTRATEAECTALVQKYFDLKAQEDPRLKTLPPTERDELVRQMKAELMATDPDMRQVVSCTDELTHREYECAIKATTTRQWNDCIE
jgi:hypothetical protein